MFDTIEKRELAIIEPAAQLSAVLQVEMQRASDRAKSAKSAATRRAYQSDFAIFTSWCAARAVSPIPAAPELVATFLNAEAERGVRASTITSRAAAIRFAHKAAGHEPPTAHEAVKLTMAGIRRDIGVAPRKKAPATSDRVIAMAATGIGMLALRDRALLLLGFAGAFRQSELVALDVADMADCAEGLRVTVRRSKTDQKGAGFVKAIPRGSIACPVKALQQWLQAACITDGPIFRPVDRHGNVRPQRLSSASVAAIVKTRAGRLGLDASSFAGHSLRAGFVTSAAARGASLFKLMDVTGHKSVDTLRGYVRDAELFKDHAGAGLL